MREFLEKLNSNKALKIVFCVVVAIPIWLIGMWLFPSKDMQETPAEVVITQDGPTETNPDNNKKPDGNTQAEIVENLDYTYMSGSECVRVITVGDIEFNEEYIKEILRKQVFNELIEAQFFKNVSYEQTAKTLNIVKQEDVDGYTETGAIGGKLYAAGYSKLGNNVFFCITVATGGNTSETTLLTGVRSAIKVTGTYILQARQDAAEKEQTETEPVETEPVDITESTDAEVNTSTTNPTDTIESTEVIEQPEQETQSAEN